jgi:hypothetical protein
MPAMASLSWCPAAVTCHAAPCDFLTRSQRFRRGASPDTRHDSHPSMPTQSSVIAVVLASHAKITGRGASNLSHGCARPVIVMVET